MRLTPTAFILCLLPATGVAAQTVAPFVDRVVSFQPGANAGFGMNEFPDVVLGPPVGGGELQGSLDVLSLGDGGEIILEISAGICDGTGLDFTVFENAFRAGGPAGAVFAEVGIVAVSADGETFLTFPYDAQTFDGLAGKTPVRSHPDNGIDPTDPDVSGGDSFDLGEIGLPLVRFVRITDPGAEIPDPGNRLPPGTSGGFDLDAIAAVNLCGGEPTPTATVTASASATPAETSVIPTSTPGPAGDVDGDGDVDDVDLALIVRAIFGDGMVRPVVDADTSLDGAVTAADVPGALRSR